MVPSSRIFSEPFRWLRRYLAGVALGFLICPAPAATAFSGGVLSHDSFLRKSPSYSIVQNALPSVQPKAPERALLNDFGYSESAEDLNLSAKNELSAEALAHYAQGLTWEDMAENEKALEEYLKVVEIDPAFTSLVLHIADVFIQREDYPRALDLLKDAAKATPDEPFIYLNIAAIYARDLKKNDLAIRYAREALKKDPEIAMGYRMLYRIYTTLGQITNAEQVLDQGMKIKSKDSGVWLQFAEIYMETAIPEEGNVAPEKLKKINTVLQKALDFSNDDPFVLSQVADGYAYSKQLENAIGLYNRILKSKDENAESLLPSVREKLAGCFLAEGRYEDAVQILEIISQKNPEKLEIYELLGCTYEQLGDLRKALESYEKELPINPGEASLYLKVSDGYLRFKQYDKAIALLTEAEKRFPDLALIPYSLAVTYNLAGEHENAIQAFERVLHMVTPREESIVNAYFYYNYGAAAEQAGKYDKAAELFKKSIDLDPANAAWALNYLGYMWVERNERLDEAEKMILRALKIDPNNGAYIDSLGWLYYKQGKYEEALQQLLKATEHMDEEDSSVYDHIGTVYEHLNNETEALKFFKKAAILDPGDEERNTKIEHLKKMLASKETS